MHPPADGVPEHTGELVVVTGMTGAGRSTAAKELEDLGFYVVDNLPPTLLKDVVRLVDDSRGRQQPIAVVVDVRSGSFFDTLQANLARGATGRRTTLLFLEASDDVLVRRQEAARRPHPLQGSGRLQVRVVSFGFKYGIPVDADFVADMRFLPNPFWNPDLRPLTGRDEPVVADVLGRPGASGFLDQIVPLLDTVAGGYLVEGKRFMTVAIGCTGGKHRSVAMTEEIARRLRDRGIEARATHRDLGRE